MSFTSSGLRHYFERFLEAVTLLLMAILASVVVAGVVFRKAGAALVWYDEMASILLAWLTYYSASLAALKRAHIGFPKLIQAVQPRIRIWLILFREVVVISFFVLVAWSGWQVLRVLGGTYLVSLPWFPSQIAQSVIPVGAVLFIIAEFISAVEVLSELSEPHSRRELH